MDLDYARPLTIFALEKLKLKMMKTLVYAYLMRKQVRGRWTGRARITRRFKQVFNFFHLTTILAINIRTALKCHNSLRFNRRVMIFFLQNLHLQKIYQMRLSWFLCLYSFRNES